MWDDRYEMLNVILKCYFDYRLILWNLNDRIVITLVLVSKEVQQMKLKLDDIEQILYEYIEGNLPADGDDMQEM